MDFETKIRQHKGETAENPRSEEDIVEEKTDRSGERVWQSAKEADAMRSKKMIADILGEIKQGADPEAIFENQKNIQEIKSRAVLYANFDLEFENVDGETQIYLHKENGEKISINGYLPKKYRLVKSHKFTANYYDKKIGFDDENNPSTFLISLFHEIGHAQEDVKEHKKPLRFITETATAIIAIMAADINYLRKNKKLPDQKEPLLKPMGIGDYDPGPDYTPRWYRERELEKKAESERGAWAYALKNLRKLEKQGVDVFAGFQDAREVIYYINYCLSTYEISRADLMKKILSEDEEFSSYINSDSFKPIFVKAKEIPDAKS